MPLVFKIGLKQFNVRICLLMSEIILICFWKVTKVSIVLSPHQSEVQSVQDCTVYHHRWFAPFCLLFLWKTCSLITAIPDLDQTKPNLTKPNMILFTSPTLWARETCKGSKWGYFGVPNWLGWVSGLSRGCTRVWQNYRC